MVEYKGDGIYRIGRSRRIWSVRKKRLDDAVPPVPGTSASGPAFGWLRGTALPEPIDHGCYVVEFLSDHEIRVLAYIDWYGRAFTLSEAIAQPPARQEDLFFTADPAHPQQGTIFVRSEEGEPVAVASFSKRGKGKGARYDLTSVDYDFGSHCKDLHYFDMMARAYLAFVYRPRTLGALLPLTSSALLKMLHSGPLDRELTTIMEHVRAAQSDPALKTNPAVALLFQWLQEAGFDELLEHPATAGNLELAHTIFYADTFYLRIQDDSAPMPTPAVTWGLEGALNRFLHLSRAFEDEAPPTRERCLEADRAFLERFAAEEPRLVGSVELPCDPSSSQWQTRLRISAGIENLVAPYRIEAGFHYDHDAGEVLFDLRVPNAILFERSSLGAPSAAPLDQAKRYAMHAGLYYVAVAFEAAPHIQRVRVMAHPISNQISYDQDEEAVSSDLLEQPWFDVAFTRDGYVATNGWADARTGDPAGAYDGAAPGSACASVRTFDSLDPLADLWEQRATLEELDAPVGAELARTWGAATFRDMTIEYNVEHHIVAREIARAIAECNDTTQAVKAIRDIQESTPANLDGQPAAPSFTRLLEALAQGALEARDREAVEACFQGEDPCREPYARAQDLEAAGDDEAAVRLLADAVAEAERAGMLADDGAEVHRIFDNYWSRLIYNLQQAGRLESDGLPRVDAGKEVLLAPDHLYSCLLDLVNLLEDTFEGTEDAIRYGKAAVSLAPTVGVAYRLLGRAYMLIGELDNAVETLQQGLRIMIERDEIAVTYYQLAYVLWQAGRPAEGALCYAKSILTSPVMAEAAGKEWQQLREEADLDLPERGQVDELLEEAGIVLAPLAALRDVTFQAAIASLDADMLSLGRDLLIVTRRAFTQDDALAGIIASI